MNHIQSVVKVFPKGTGRRHLAQIAIGGGDNPDIHARDHMVGANFLNFAGLEEPQQQALHAQGHFPYFIQKHRAVVGDLELAGFITVGTGEAALHMPKKFGLEERFGKAGTIDGHERSIRSRAQRVNGRWPPVPSQRRFHR